MIKLGVNSVLFQSVDLATAMKHIAWAGYDGVELSAIKGMCEHLVLDDWERRWMRFNRWPRNTIWRC